MSSATSTAPYNLEELHSILDLTNSINSESFLFSQSGERLTGRLENVGKISPGSVNLVGKLRTENRSDMLLTI